MTCALWFPLYMLVGVVSAVLGFARNMKDPHCDGWEVLPTTFFWFAAWPICWMVRGMLLSEDAIDTRKTAGRTHQCNNAQTHIRAECNPPQIQYRNGGNTLLLEMVNEIGKAK